LFRLERPGSRPSRPPPTSARRPDRHAVAFHCRTHPAGAAV